MFLDDASIIGTFYQILIKSTIISQEDPTVNRLEESLNLFGQIVNNPFFRDASFVLLLNKFDLFREKILYSNRHLRLYFSDYKGRYGHRFTFIHT